MKLAGWFGLGGAIALGLMYSAWSVQVSDLRAAHASAIAAEQKRASDTQAAFDKYKLEVEQTNTANATNFANATRELWLKWREQERAGDDLRARAVEAERRREASAAELLRILNDAKPEQVVRIGPAVRDFLDRVRREQRGAAIQHDQAARGNPD